MEQPSAPADHDELARTDIAREIFSAGDGYVEWRNSDHLSAVPALDGFHRLIVR